MRRYPLAIVALALCLGPALASGPQPFADKTLGFAAAFPGTPMREEKITKIPAGAVTTTSFKLGQYSVTVHDYSTVPGAATADPQAMALAALGKAVRDQEGIRVHSVAGEPVRAGVAESGPITFAVPGGAGAEAYFSVPTEGNRDAPGVARIRTYVVWPHVYDVMATADSDSFLDKGEYAQYFESFHPLDNGGARPTRVNLARQW